MKKCTEYKEYILIGALLLMYFIKGMGLFSWMPIYKYIYGLACVIIGVSILFTKYSLKEWIVCILMGIVGMAVIYTNHDISFISIVLVVFAIKNIDIDKWFPKLAIVWNAGLILTVLLSFFNIKEDIVREYDKAFLGTVYRHSYGFNSDIALSLTATLGIVMIAYSLKKYAWWKMLILEALFPIIFFQTYSYTSIALGMMAVLGIYISRVIESKSVDRIKSISTMLLAVGAVIPVVVSIPPVMQLLDCNNKIIGLFNKLTNNRILIAQGYLEYVKPTLFGQIYDTSLAPTNWGRCQLDNAYVFFYANWGIIPVVLVISMYLLGLYLCMKNKRMTDAMLLLFFTWYGFAENFLKNPFMNYSVLIIGSLLWTYIEYRKMEKN